MELLLSEKEFALFLASTIRFSVRKISEYETTWIIGESNLRKVYFKKEKDS